MGKKKPSRKSLKKAEQAAKRGRWYNLVELKRIPEFSAWLTNDAHEWQGQSPDTGEALRLYKYGEILTIQYDGKRTICNRHGMALWYTFLCFHDNVFGKDDNHVEVDGH